MTTPDPLTAFRALVEAATPGEMAAEPHCMEDSCRLYVDGHMLAREMDTHDARAIAASHNVMPELLAVVGELERESREMGECLLCCGTIIPPQPHEGCDGRCENEAWLHEQNCALASLEAKMMEVVG